eukprot:572357-Pyramimonas_sp.AAC.1
MTAAQPARGSSLTAWRRQEPPMKRCPQIPSVGGTEGRAAASDGSGSRSVYQSKTTPAFVAGGGARSPGCLRAP